MNLEKEKPVNEEVAELKELIKELHGSVHQLQSEVQQLRHERPVVEVRKGVHNKVRCNPCKTIHIQNKIPVTK
ncbi:hypothetical protein ACT4UL_09905, partial [Bacillus sp. HC-TM]